MQMATRIRRSWQVLVDRLAGLEAADPLLLQHFKDWVRTSPATVSKKAAESLSRGPGVRLLLERESRAIPLTKGALKELLSALASKELPEDPDEYAALVERLCWRMAVFRRDDDCCRASESCDGNLELWTDGNDLFEVCTAWPTHYFDLAGHRLDDAPDGLRPADRREILASNSEAKRLLAT